MTDHKRGAWYQALEGHVVLVHLMDQDLRRDCDVPLMWYDVLIKVWLAPGHTVRMRDLAQQVLLSRSWLTRRVVQLEDAGLLQRRPADDDGRGVVATLTPRGAEVFVGLERSHAASVRTHFSDLITDEEADVIARAYRRIAEHGRTHLH